MVLMGGSLTLAACEAANDRDGVVTARVLYGIQYTSPGTYDDAEATAALSRCTKLRGASSAGQDDSLPPQPSVRFEGSLSDQDRLEQCLAALPDVKVLGPRPLPTGAP